MRPLKAHQLHARTVYRDLWKRTQIDATQCIHYRRRTPPQERNVEARGQVIRDERGVATPMEGSSKYTDATDDRRRALNAPPHPYYTFEDKECMTPMHHNQGRVKSDALSTNQRASQLFFLVMSELQKRSSAAVRIHFSRSRRTVYLLPAGCANGRRHAASLKAYMLKKKEEDVGSVLVFRVALFGCTPRQPIPVDTRPKVMFTTVVFPWERHYNGAVKIKSARISRLR